MRVSLRLSVALASLVLFGAAQSSQAATIDFTNAAAWGGVAGLTSFGRTVDGILVTVTSENGNLTFNNGGDVNASCAGSTGLSCQGDGLGVGDDEVTFGSSLLSTSLERLRVTFSAPVSITKLGFLDLFATNTLVGDTAPETAMWAVLQEGGGIVASQVTGTDSSTTLGYKAVDTSYTNVIALQFFAVPPANPNSDFAVARIDFTKTAVPEPATLLLSGLGFVVVSSLRSRRRRAA